MSDVAMVPYDISFLPEYKAVTLCYIILNHFHTATLHIMAQQKVQQHFRKCCNVHLL